MFYMFNTTFSVAMVRAPLKEINLLMCNSPITYNNTYVDQQISTIEITNKKLRTQNSDALFTSYYTEGLNKKDTIYN